MQLQSFKIQLVNYIALSRFLSNILSGLNSLELWLLAMLTAYWLCLDTIFMML